MSALETISAARSLALTVLALAAMHRAAPAAELPFQHAVDVYRAEDAGATAGPIAFAIRLEQPFLAEEFERTGALRLEPLDDRAYLIYPRETRFDRRHAEFHGRLLAPGPARLRLTWEVVAEQADGAERRETRSTEVTVAVPDAPAGPAQVLTEWAREQDAHFARQLDHYPAATFYEYVLLRSEARYGVAPPEFRRPDPSRALLEHDLFHLFRGGLAMQASLQRDALHRDRDEGRPDVLLGRLSPPSVVSAPYLELEERRAAAPAADPRLELARLVPEDQYLIALGSDAALDELADLAQDLVTAPARLLLARAHDHGVREKLERQLLVDRRGLAALLDGGFAVTGSDLFVLEGTDITLLFRPRSVEAFERADEAWVARAREGRADLEERAFHYRGERVVARYTSDREISSFTVELDGVVARSNSHRAIRRVVDTHAGELAALYDADDHRLAAGALPPDPAGDAAWLYVSDAFHRHLLAPGLKIAEKRRVECFNQLVMLNNAVLLFRMENRRAPRSLAELIDGRYVDGDRLACPHGGTYAYDAARDASVCSLHNRLRYLTPIIELPVDRVTAAEQKGYAAYKTRYEREWRGLFTPVAARWRGGERPAVELWTPPLVGGDLFEPLRAACGDGEGPVGAAPPAPAGAFASISLVPGRARIAEAFEAIPALYDSLDGRPDLLDYSWLGDRVTLHLGDGAAMLEVDPSRIREAPLPFLSGIPEQSLVSLLWLATDLPMTLSFELRDLRRAQAFVETLEGRVFLQYGDAFGLDGGYDGYRLPPHRGAEIHALTYRLHAVTARLFVSVTGGQLLVSTRAEALTAAIDALRDGATVDDGPPTSELLLAPGAIERLRGDLERWGDERARIACHANLPAVESLARHEQRDADDVDDVARARYGVRYLCPDGGGYVRDPDSGDVACTLHGRRERSRQPGAGAPGTAIRRLLERFARIRLTVLADADELRARLEIARAPTRDG